MEDWLIRERMLIGDDAVNEISSVTAAVFGLGGVGGGVAEGLIRAGIGRLILIDHDIIAESNLNRQILSTRNNIGQAKTEAAKDRCVSINPKAAIDIYSVFADVGNIERIITETKPDYIVDAVDTVTSKLVIAETALKYNIKMISCMGTGNKLDPSRLKIADISKTSVCPLARVMRRELKTRGINHMTVLFSDEEPVKTGARTPASVSFVPPAAGYMIAGWIIRDILYRIKEQNIE